MTLTLAEQTLILSCLENYEGTLQEHRGAYVANGNETGAKHILESIIPRILFVDCIVTPSIRDVASNSRNALSVVDKLQNEGVDLFTMIDGEIFKTSSTISVLRAFHNKKQACAR